MTSHMSCSSDHSPLWENDSPSTSISSVDSSPHEVSKLEADFYYFGLHGSRRRGPKLIFRTSKDVFIPPSGPEQEPCAMQLLPVYEHHILSEGDLWPIIRSKAVKLLDQRNVQHSSIDLVRFSWVKENEEDSSIAYSEIKLSPYRTAVITPVTIWVGVLPGTLTGEAAFEASINILSLLREHGISDLDVAYRESVAEGSSGPQLWAPVSNINPLKAVIDPITTAVSLPIAGYKTLSHQGTLGFYFRAGKDLYAVTACHVLFPDDKDNNAYAYTAGPRKEVVLMGNMSFDNFLGSLQDHIGIMNTTVFVMEKLILMLTQRLMNDGPNAEEVTRELNDTQCELTKTRAAIEQLNNFSVKIKKQWMNPEDRVIGHVVWAPPISVYTHPHGHTIDVCIVKLNKKKFSQNFRGNVLDLGPEINTAKFIHLMYPRVDVPLHFHYPVERLLKLEGILTAKDIRTPNSKNIMNDPVRHVIKRGCATQTTIGCLNGFESHVRRYSVIGNHDSVEAAVYPYDNGSGPFSMRGDSGSIIVDALGKFVALLTGGTGVSDSFDITYGTPMHIWWDIIKTRFPDANIYFNNDNY